jgi:hypothetical protein
MTREAPTSADIQLHIEEVVLDGFSELDRHGFDAALQSELQRLLSSQEVASALRRGGQKGVARLDLGTLEHAPTASSSQLLGRELARAILRSVTAPAPPSVPAASSRQPGSPPQEKGVQK